MYQIQNETSLAYILRFRRAHRFAVSVSNKYEEGETIDMFLSGITEASKYTAQKLECEADRRRNIPLSFSQVKMIFTAIDSAIPKRKHNANTTKHHTNIKCNYCNKMGHLESNCRKKKGITTNLTLPNKVNSHVIIVGSQGIWQKNAALQKESRASSQRIPQQHNLHKGN